ncbi:MAG: KH domain-containing protein [Verrucomicrobiae bacterium]|nr:KH domain-containing protein [Verrucomicrobiae bacterium]
MKEFIEYVVKALVDYPDQVDVRQVDGDRTIVFELRLNQTDVGKIIGKKGRTIQALRTLVNGASGKQGKRAMVEIIEEGRARQEGAPPPEADAANA